MQRLMDTISTRNSNEQYPNRTPNPADLPDIYIQALDVAKVGGDHKLEGRNVIIT